MIYKHRYFQFDTESKRIFDENRKELRLTGNALRVLNFLCEKKSANITEIGAFLDWAKDYDENHMRQYRYKVNSIIGHDVIEYKNGIYFLIGEVQEVEKMEPSERNTDLLQAQNVKLEDIMKKSKNIENEYERKNHNLVKENWFKILAILFLLGALGDNPYDYYQFLRWAMLIIGGYLAYLFYKLGNKIWLWIFGAIVLLFNPIVPFTFQRDTWQIIDVVVAIIFTISIFKKYEKNG